eukprot:Phypoly_transcript_09618.p1 GENE.Phypoly_transcript_09618~~Phypoly_transcript_09618.p1  ORF type:complete len:312 (-),score=41.15 Phypoly_transcript_09618:183-1118(-)
MPQQKSAINIVFGTGTFGKISQQGVNALGDLPTIQLILDTVKAHGHHELDTARLYGAGTSETLLGEIDYAGQGFIIDTKVPGFGPGQHSAENVAKSVAESLKELKTNKVHILYLHAPERTTPFAETLAAINEEYKKGHFERFGLSNYTAQEVEEIVKIAKENNYVIPSVYQGNYNLAARGGEDTLFPVLRKFGFSFYAYSPLAGSFLTGASTKDRRTERLDDSHTLGQMYCNMFCKDSYFQALDELRAVAEKHGLTVSEIALRWLTHHSLLKREHGDAIVMGGKTLSYIQNTLGGSTLSQFRATKSAKGKK